MTCTDRDYFGRVKQKQLFVNILVLHDTLLKYSHCYENCRLK